MKIMIYIVIFSKISELLEINIPRQTFNCERLFSTYKNMLSYKIFVDNFCYNSTSPDCP